MKNASKLNWIIIRIGVIRVLLMAASLSFLGILILALFPMLRGYYVDGVTQFGGSFLPDQDQVALVYIFNAPTDGDSAALNQSLISRDIVAIYAPEKFVYDLGNFCFDYIVETNLVKSPYGSPTRSRPSSRSSLSSSDSIENRYELGGFVKDECVDTTNARGQWIDYGYRTREISVGGSSKFYFPYDNLEYDAVVLLLGEDTSDQENVTDVSLVPRVVGQVLAPNWDVKVSVVESYEGDHPGARIRIEYTRPLLYRLLVPTLLLLMLGVIIALPAIRDTSTFLETLIGIIFGLWGLHEVLIPADVTWPTVIDPLILSLYALLGFFTLLRVVVIPVWKKVGK